MFVYAVLLALVAVSTHGAPCEDLSGVWFTERGSNMTLEHRDTCRIIGRFDTAVEILPGLRGSSQIAGLVKPVDGGSLVSFNFLWKNGESITSLVGQCIVCDGKEMIFTTNTKRSLQKPVDNWMSTFIMQNTFMRSEIDQPKPVPEISDDGVNRDILGLWNSITEDALNFTFAAQAGKLEGVHLLPDYYEEVQESWCWTLLCYIWPWCSPNNEVDLFGLIAGDKANFTGLAFSSAGPKYMRGWTGHIYNPNEPNPVLETSWIAHGFSDNCNYPRRFTYFGMNNYTKPM